MAVERGTLAIADISGYTGYLAGTELEHAPEILVDLLERLRPPGRAAAGGA